MVVIRQVGEKLVTGNCVFCKKCIYSDRLATSRQPHAEHFEDKKGTFRNCILFCFENGENGGGFARKCCLSADRCRPKVVDTLRFRFQDASSMRFVMSRGGEVQRITMEALPTIIGSDGIFLDSSAACGVYEFTWSPMADFGLFVIAAANIFGWWCGALEISQGDLCSCKASVFSR